MRKMNNLAWLSAIALTGLAGFTACSEDDALENVNPSFDGKNVKTQFAINVPRAQTTRQTEAITQANGNSFRGMQDVKLFSATTSIGSTTALNPITLDETIANNGLENTFRKVYADVTIPVGTTHFLFYGQATEDGDANNNGVLTMSADANTPADITFSLNQIHSTTLSDATLLGYLNSICETTGWSTQATDSQLGIAYKSFTSLTAGSAQSILKAVERLYNSITPLADADAAAGTQGAIAHAIKTQIEEAFTATSGTNGYTLTYKTESNFPENLGLPQGAARLIFATNAFNYNTVSNINGMAINPTTICYPAALYYHTGNTPLWANNNDQITWPTTLANWAITGSWTGWGTSVTATTRTIALQKTINYGVALLKSNVKTATGTLEDNAKAQGGAAANNTITVGETTFPVTAILVGGQPAGTDWGFNPTGEKNQTIYDNVMNGTNIYATTSNTAVNYTMVLDNKATTDEQDKVNIAVELTNNSGQDFYGADGLVPAGGKFYLVAQLDPTSATDEPKRVFAQDYTTIVNLTVKSLQNAYVTIPDLRSTKLQLGLAVDLAWQAGITFNVEIN